MEGEIVGLTAGAFVGRIVGLGVTGAIILTTGFFVAAGGIETG